MTFPYNHFGSQFNQLVQIENQLVLIENPIIVAKIVEIGSWTHPVICDSHFPVVGHLRFGIERGLKQSKKFHPMIFSLFYTKQLGNPNSVWAKKSRQLHSATCIPPLTT